MKPVKKSKYECDCCKQRFNRVKTLQKHLKKGCNNTTCDTCSNRFRDSRMLKHHQKHATINVCTHCYKKFCNTDDYEKHQRSIPPSPLSHDPEYNLDTPVCPKTGYEDMDGYKEQLDNNYNLIRDNVVQRTVYMRMNKELTPEFTYRDLRNMLYDIFGNEKFVYKTNMGFGFMLYHVVNKYLKYFYVTIRNSVSGIYRERCIQVISTHCRLRFNKQLLLKETFIRLVVGCFTKY